MVKTRNMCVFLSYEQMKKTKKGMLPLIRILKGGSEVKTLFAELTFDETKISGDIQSKLKSALLNHGINVIAVTDKQPGGTLRESGMDKKDAIQVQSDLNSAGAGGMVSP
ncbi:hypothetical protein AWH49_08725 [Domibacillus aminovorans]|uniref:Uncharacterized protein n=1 Tax=Domibacillus aminovorans TaxID=29332 RepID=A0A177LDR1_9BACI|nr:hypothetical protein AWH49_08725 [Domibacillus aminovorans]